MRSATIQIIGTQMTPRAQGQIGARVFHLNGKLTIQPTALELQPWDDPMAGLQPDIDGRGDFVAIGVAVYVRVNTLNAWQPVSADDSYWSLFANINPTRWATFTGAKTLGEASVAGFTAWAVQGKDSSGRQLKVWLRKQDSYPLRYTVAWDSVKGSTYYVNALYRDFNSEIGISAPDMSNRGIVPIGAPVRLPAGSVTVTGINVDCAGTAVRHPAAHDKLVFIETSFVDSGPDEIAIAPDAWRLYGDVDGAVPIDIDAPGLLRTQALHPGQRVSGSIAFEVPDDAYQLWSVGKMTGATAVVSIFLPILPAGQSPCA